MHGIPPPSPESKRARTTELTGFTVFCTILRAHNSEQTFLSCNTLRPAHPQGVQQYGIISQNRQQDSAPRHTCGKHPTGYGIRLFCLLRPNHYLSPDTDDTRFVNEEKYSKNDDSREKRETRVVEKRAWIHTVETRFLLVFI